MCKIELFPDSWLFWGRVWNSQVDLCFASNCSSWRWHYASGLQLLHNWFSSWRGLFSTPHMAKSASDFDLPAKVSKAALPVVGYEASEVSPELWGSALWLGTQGQYHFQPAEIDLGNTICLWPWGTIWMHRQRVACCVPRRKQLLKISWLEFKTMNLRQKSLWYYIR